MRKLVIIGMAVALAVGLTACGSDDDTSSPTATTAADGTDSPCGDTPVPAAAADFKPVKGDTLSVITSLPGPGFWEGSDSDPTKLNAGYEYDIARCLQEMFGLADFSVRNVSFEAIETGTATNYDLALSQTSITPEREKVVDFSEPYFESRRRPPTGGYRAGRPRSTCSRTSGSTTSARTPTCRTRTPPSRPSRSTRC
jgi:polar amino acid transport system substrate-binding protein